MPKTYKQEIGDLGEKLSTRYLLSKGFVLVGRNYRKPWGEIDVIVEKKGRIHFVEVKTVSWEVSVWGVTHETKLTAWCRILLGNFFGAEYKYSIIELREGEKVGEVDEYRPEDNLHSWKLKRLGRAIQSYFSEKGRAEEDDWQLDAITLRLDTKNNRAILEYLEDIVI